MVLAMTRSQSKKKNLVNMSIQQQYSNILNSLRSIPSANDPEFCQTWQTLLQSVLKLNQLAQSLSLTFSSNETAEDVSTPSLPFVLLPFYIAEILRQSNEKQPQIRIVHLNQAVGYFNLFLEGTGQLGIMGEIAGKFRDRDGNLQLPSNPADKRWFKVEGFKRRKQITSQLQEAGFDEIEWILEAQKESCQDEEVQRQLWMLKIEHAVLDSIDQISNIELEMEMLKIATERQTEPKNEQNQQLQQPTKTRPIILGSDRTQLQEQVFKPFHILPTMTPEQFGEIEIRRMHEREEQEKVFKSQQQKLSQQEQEDEDLQKAREWDEFKDDNPRGWGNSQLKPCA
eukprot:TRINITY_DN393_c0_g2_i1.p1 TRINITY_DN393_c0_g2~~TRINITY_DN393_c0_g2_i1.p1  ORF type:complete len:341 (-),score=36.91 TRINITY_DN393_c0_g2_i1:367-1389(-)